MNVLSGGMHWEKLALKWHCHGQDTFGVKIKYLMEWYQQDLVCKSTLFYVDFNGESLRINLQCMSSSIKVSPNWIEDIKLKSPSKEQFWLILMQLIEVRNKTVTNLGRQWKSWREKGKHCSNGIWNNTVSTKTTKVVNLVVQTLIKAVA